MAVPVDRIARDAVICTYNSVYYSAWDTMASIADYIVGLPYRDQEKALRKCVSKMLPQFANEYGLLANRETRREWTHSITETLSPKLVDGSIFRQPGNVLDVNFPNIPPVLFNSMLAYFDITKMDILRLEASMLYLAIARRRNRAN